MDSEKTSYPNESLPLHIANDSETSPKAYAPRALRDSAEMSDVELLTLLLGQSARPACERLLAERCSLRGLALAHPLDWREAGLAETRVRKLAAVLEIAKRYGETEWVAGIAFRGSGDVYAHFRERLATETREHFYAVLLDNKHRKIRDVLLSLGSLTASIIHPRDVFSRIVRESAASVIFVHNHPSGDPTPSREDIEITRRLRETGDVLGVRILDHIVIGKGRYVSFVDDGYW